MAIDVPVGYYQCKIRWVATGDPEEMICTIGVHGNEPGDRDLLDVAHAVYNAFEGAFPPALLHSAFALVGCDVHDSPAISAARDVASWDEVTPGTGTWDPLSSNCAMLIKKRTAKGGRRNVGRMFLPSGYLSAVDTNHLGEISSTNQVVYQNCATQFLDNLRDASTLPGQPIADFEPVVFHDKTELVAIDPTPITGLTVDRLIATQRQRMRR
jgi:hypothetical protein